MVVTMREDHLTPSANPPVDVTSWTQATDPRDRSRAGIATRTKAPLDAHAIWKVKEGRREAISLLEEQSAIRVPDLIPLRYKRMSASPFTFYRGTVLIMTNDLASTPVTGIPVQCVGDAHIGNFGIFRSPSARIFRAEGFFFLNISYLRRQNRTILTGRGGESGTSSLISPFFDINPVKQTVTEFMSFIICA